MPHINVKMYTGRNKEEKEKIAKFLANALVETGINESAISVSITDVDKENWKTEVYDKELTNNKDLFIKPGYKM